MSALATFTRRALGASAALLLSLSVVRAQDPDPLAKLDQSTRFTVQLLIDTAETSGLPSAALRSTALQGIALKASGRQIVDAVKKVLQNLRTARTVLGPVSGEELETAAAVLHAGAKPAQLAAFRVRQKGRSDLEAFVVWADLLTRSISSEEASAAITKLWQEGADDATFQSLWTNVQADISLGLNPGAALQNRIRETPGRAPPKIPPPEGQETDRAR
jgi:hypothetical protein